MNLREFRPGLWLTEMASPEFDVCGNVIVGADRILVWDTLFHPRDMAPVVDLAGTKPIFVVYSHSDWDHCWGTAGLGAQVVIAHSNCAADFKNGVVARELAEKQAAEPGEWDDVQLIAPNITLTGMLTVDLGGLSVELHPLPGHKKDCLVAFIPEMGVLLAGDTVETPLPYFSDDTGPLLEAWIAGLEVWHADPRVEIVIPAHGAVDTRATIAHNLAYLRALESGRDADVPPVMTPFYTETHARNQVLAAQRRHG
jgi:glyoxylase-like metal-dependent hydrolase (beta-lactamase superfamily II)